MVSTIEQNYINQFAGNAYHLLEQKTSKFKGIFQEEVANGEKHFFDRLGSFETNRVGDRNAPTELQDAAHSRRMATVNLDHAGTTLATIDKFKLLADPTSDYTMKLVSAHGRNYDRERILELVGSASTGKDGTGSEALPSTQKIAHGSVGLTLEKLISTKTIFNQNELMEGTKLYCAVDPTGIDDLLREDEIQTIDKNVIRALVAGEVDSFMGMKFIMTNQIPKIDSSTFRAIVFTENALKVAIGKQLDVKTAERPDLDFAYQVSTYMAHGGVRMDEKEVVEIAYQ